MPETKKPKKKPPSELDQAAFDKKKPRAEWDKKGKNPYKSKARNKQLDEIEK